MHTLLVTVGDVLSYDVDESVGMGNGLRVQRRGRYLYMCIEAPTRALVRTRHTRVSRLNNAPKRI